MILLHALKHGDLNPDQATNRQKTANIQAIEESNWEVISFLNVAFGARHSDSSCVPAVPSICCYTDTLRRGQRPLSWMIKPLPLHVVCAAFITKRGRFSWVIVEAYSAVLLNPLCISAGAMPTVRQNPWRSKPFLVIVCKNSFWSTPTPGSHGCVHRCTDFREICPHCEVPEIHSGHVQLRVREHQGKQLPKGWVS